MRSNLQWWECTLSYRPTVALDVDSSSLYPAIQYHPVSSSILYRKTPALPALLALVLLCPVEVIPWKAWAAWWAAPRRPTSEGFHSVCGQRGSKASATDLNSAQLRAFDFILNSSASKCTENRKPTKFQRQNSKPQNSSAFWEVLGVDSVDCVSPFNVLPKFRCSWARLCTWAAKIGWN